MIKMNYKKIGGAILFLGFLVSNTALAVTNVGEDGNTTNREERIREKQEEMAKKQEERTQKMEERKIEITANICEKISEMADQMSQKVSEREGELKSKRDEKISGWSQKTGERDAELLKFRADGDENMSAHFAKLEERAKTDEQKKAVADFEAAVKTAVATRRSAIDVAIKTFRTGVQSAIDSRKSQIDSVASTFKSAQAAAFEKAKKSCASSTANAQTIRTQLKSDLSAAKNSFQADRKSAEKVGSTIQALIDARKIAFEKAISDFKVAMEKAKTELKKDFPKDDNVETDSASTTSSQ